MLLLLPVAYLLAAGRWWALLIPLATAVPLVGVTPAIAYPMVFWVALLAVLVVGIRARAQEPARAPSSPGDTAARPRDPPGSCSRRRLGGHLLAGEPPVRRRPGRLLLPGRRVPPRPDVARLPARPVRRHHVGGHFYVPFAPFPAVALMPLVAIVGPITADQMGIRDQRAPRGGRRRPVLEAARPDRRRPSERPALADDPVRRSRRRSCG